MKIGGAWGAVVFGLAVVVGGAVGGLYLIPKRDVLDDTYSRICVEITSKRLIRPSSMEIIRAFAGIPKDQEKGSLLSEIRADADPKYPNITQWREEKAERNYAAGRPNKTVDAFVEYSAANRMGGLTRGATVCSFTEEPDYDGSYGFEIVKVILDDTTITSKDLEWYGTVDSDELHLAKVNPGMAARVKYLFDRTSTR